VLYIVRAGNTHFACFISRKNTIIYVPCISCAYDELIIDGELMPDNKTFLAFDCFRTDHFHTLHEHPIRTRISRLSELALPELLGFRIQLKPVYPASKIANVYQQLNVSKHADGIIVHDVASVSNMYKWKSVHTVDLWVTEHGLRAQDSMYVPLDTPPSGTKIGELWEFSFDEDNHPVVPVKRRTDKTRANPRKVVQEIKLGHMANIDICKLARNVLIDPERPFD